MVSSIKKIPFKVSARTARLIGRENVATSQGAIIELVKNAYDADANMCAICFLQKYTEIPNILKLDEYANLVNHHSYCAKLFERKENLFHLIVGITESEYARLKQTFKGIVDLWIIDNGSGMSSEIIEDKWMVIGTNTKETNSKSTAGRIMTGAKGIGRFALDRLGEKSDLYSATANNSELVHWAVDWNAFDGEEKILDDIKAELGYRYQLYFDLLSEVGLRYILPESFPSELACSAPLSYNSGTAICIQQLRDIWDDKSIEILKGTLEVLLPASDQRDFSLFVYDQRSSEHYGWIDNSLPEQYDYRLIANVKEDGEVEIRLDRKEIDADKILPNFFSLDDMKIPGYTDVDFRNGFYSYKTSLEKILNPDGSLSIDPAKKIGPFNFTLYYFKLSNPSKNILKKYPQKKIDASKRRQWLNHSGGIRLYRDGFRVRPYGEPRSQSSDWLLLGERTAQNPGGVGSKGSWRVPPHQVAGTIHISKVYNPLLDDQSNREGIMNERVFYVFRQIIVGLIHEFEKDRNRIYLNFNRAYENVHKISKDLNEGDKIAKKIIANKGNNSSGSSIITNDHLKLATAYEIRTRENKDLNDEIQVLRGLATLGTVLVAFTHELKQIKTDMDTRQSQLRKSLELVVDPNRMNAIPVQVNPFNILKRWELVDQKVSSWIEFTLSSVARSKRRRKPILWQDYFSALFTFWNEILLERKIQFIVPVNLENKLTVLAHEIDLDSLFFNLIINSIEVLTRPSLSKSRMIEIKYLSCNENEVVFEYSDNGPGIPDVFKSTTDIFNYGETSKPEFSGQKIEGTGIGMAIVKAVVDDYGGHVSILSQLGGPRFRLHLCLPRHIR